jgi:hypothetical protein
MSSTVDSTVNKDASYQFLRTEFFCWSSRRSNMLLRTGVWQMYCALLLHTKGHRSCRPYFLCVYQVSQILYLIWGHFSAMYIWLCQKIEVSSWNHPACTNSYRHMWHVESRLHLQITAEHQHWTPSNENSESTMDKSNRHTPFSFHNGQVHLVALPRTTPPCTPIASDRSSAQACHPTFFSTTYVI